MEKPPPGQPFMHSTFWFIDCVPDARLRRCLAEYLQARASRVPLQLCERSSLGQPFLQSSGRFTLDTWLHVSFILLLIEERPTRPPV